MYDKILVAVDHSEISDRAVLAARDLALLSKGEVWVLHLREREMASRAPGIVADETMDEARATVQAIVDKLTAAGVKAHGEVRNRSEEHTSELQSHVNLVCRLLLEKKKK